MEGVASKVSSPSSFYIALLYIAQAKSIVLGEEIVENDETSDKLILFDFIVWKTISTLLNDFTIALE